MGFMDIVFQFVLCLVFGVRRMLQVHCFGVSEVSRLVLQFQVLVSNDFKVYLTKAFVKKSIKGCQRPRCLFLQV